MRMNVSLTRQLQLLVRRKVASGLYTSAAEVVREALRLLDGRDRGRATLRREIEAGLESGPAVPADVEAIIADRRKYRKRARR